MAITFDHLVLLVNDLDVAARDFEALGFTVQERADSKRGSTIFRFVSFPDGSYILLTAFTGEARNEHRLSDVLASGEGWADYSFVVPDAKATGMALSSGRYPNRGPVRVSNVLAGGQTWSLDLVMTGRGAGGNVALPFVVSDVEGRSHRIPAPSKHANGATGIRGLTVSTDDPGAVANTLVTIGGTQAAGKGGAIRVVFRDVWVDVVALADAPNGRPGGGMVEALLTSSSNVPARGRVLDTVLTHNAPIRLVEA